MHKLFKLWNLTLFAEGASAGDGGDGGAATGETSVAAAQDGMDNLGIPKDKLERYRSIKAKNNPAPVESDEPQDVQPQQAEAVLTESEEPAPDYDAEFEKITKNPEYNKRIQAIVGNRVKGMKATLADLTPVLETLGQKYGMDVTDVSKMDFKTLAQKVQEDDSYFEDAAAELGSSSETAKKVWEAELAQKRKDLTAREEMERRHEENLRQQAAEFSKKPGMQSFNLAREMMNPQFARMVSPGGGLTVEQAFNAIHHDTIVAFEREAAAKQALQSVSNSIKAGKSMPAENGSVPRASTNTQTKMYSQMTKAEQEIWRAQKKREAANRHGR